MMVAKRYPGEIQGETNKSHLTLKRRGLRLEKNACTDVAMVQDRIYKQEGRPPPRRSKRNKNMRTSQTTNDESYTLAENETKAVTVTPHIEQLGTVYPGQLYEACNKHRFFQQRFEHRLVTIETATDAGTNASDEARDDLVTDAGSDQEDFEVCFIGLRCLQFVHSDGKNTLSDPKYQIQNPPNWLLVEAVKQNGPHYRSIVPARLCRMCSKKAWSTSYCKQHSHWSRLMAKDLVMTRDGRVGRVAQDGHHTISTFSSERNKFIKSIHIGYESIQRLQCVFNLCEQVRICDCFFNESTVH